MNELRKKAEELVDQINLKEIDLKSKDKISIIYELLVHQRELEIQNEEIRRANLELEELKNRYFELYNTAPVGYITLNDVGIIVNYNHTFLEMLKLSGNSIKGRAFLDYIHPNDSKYFLANYRDFYQQPEGKSLELRIIRTKGFIHVLIKGRKEKSTGNLNLTITDITDLKESQKRINTYMSIIEESPVSIIITDRNNNIIYVNKHCTETTGYTKEEIIGRNPGFLKSGKTPPETYKALWSTLNSKKTWEGVFINKKKNGELYTEEAKITPIFDENGNIMNYVAIKSDITEKMILQEKEKNIAKAKSLITISSGIAHHLNNINTPILIMAQDLYNELKDNQKLAEKIQIIIKSVSRATNIINSIMKFSKTAIIMPKRVSLQTVVNFVINNSRELLTEKIKIVKEVEEIADHYVKVDIDMFSQAFNHIIKNSVEAMPNGGLIRVKLYIEEQKKNEDMGRFACFEIQDSGVGIPSHILSNIFDPFFTTKFMHNSPGLGLSEVLGIMEQHGGKVEIDSEVNKGTVVRLYLPIIEQE